MLKCCIRVKIWHKILLTRAKNCRGEFLNIADT